VARVTRHTYERGTTATQRGGNFRPLWSSLVKNLRRTTSGAGGCGLSTTIRYLRGAAGTTAKYLRRAAGIGLGATFKYRRRTASAAAGSGLGTTIKYLVKQYARGQQPLHKEG